MCTTLTTTNRSRRQRVSDAEQVAIQDETIEEFAAHDEPGADPLLGGPDDVGDPEDGDAMCLRRRRRRQDDALLDLACHLAAGDPWLGIPVAARCASLLIENEGPRPLFRRKLRRKRDAWAGSPIDGRLRVLEAPLGVLSFAEPATGRARRSDPARARSTS